MQSLMAAWEKDAHILIQLGLPNIKTMPQRAACNLVSVSDLTDDEGNQITLDKPLNQFLPQTYLAATVLLAVVPPEQIVAIPKGMRDLPHIYPPLLLDQISLDIDRYNSEMIYQAHPDVAFVAHYSHPATRDALKNQGIPLCMIKNVNTLPDILKAIRLIGYIANQKEKTDLLLTFVKAAMYAIDNRLRALTWQVDPIILKQKFLFVHYSIRFALPTTKSMTGQLLQRVNEQTKLFFIPVSDSMTEWKIPVTHETIVCENPKGLIVSYMFHDQKKPPQISLEGMDSLHENGIVFVDEMIQQSLTQHIALAYFDIFHSLTTIFHHSGTRNNKYNNKRLLQNSL
jgi:iron complex transport system substrate-binding protein